MKETFVGDSPEEIYEKITYKYGRDFEIIESKVVLFGGKNCHEITINISKDIFMANSFGQMALERIKKGNSPSSLYQITKENFVKHGIDPLWLEDIFAMLEEEIDDKNLLEQYVLEELESCLKISQENIHIPKIIMLAGTTGVGKTTTLAKLAARYGYMMSRPHSIALVNLDQYRVGAAQQLKTYAQMMQIPYRNAYTNDEFASVLEGLEGIDVIFVDTAGASPFDIEKILQTTTFLTEHRQVDISVLLAIPASLKSQDFKEVYDHFSFLDLDGLVISKLDETRYLGSLINFLITCPTPIAYFTTGQEVPDDLQVASSAYLIERFRAELHRN